ncbi:MAG: sensor histidine kinase [Acidimicrobiales bacterium]
MTFRSRLVLAATAAVLVVVVLGSIATYLVAYNALLTSIDVNLQTGAQASLASPVPDIPNLCTGQGSCIQVVGSDGSVGPGAPPVLPLTNQVRASAVSQGNAPDQYFSTTVGGSAVRELAIALPPRFVYRAGGITLQLPTGGAAQFTAPLTGVNRELGRLALALWIIVIIGVTMAILLGLAVGRTVLRPLNSLTRTVEELAASTDAGKLLDPGGPDELGRLRRAFNRLLTALDASRVSQRQLVLDASHELRTPLTSLRTNMEVARRLEELEPADREVLISDVLTQMDELTSLVGDLAELARGEQPTVTSEPFRLDQIVLEAVEVATTHGRSRGVVFDASVAPTWVSGAPARIERAIDNLLDNALKWSPDNGVVEVSCSEGMVLVRDHGPGVDPSDVDFIFDRFYRAPGARGRPGSGLGLAIVAQVAHDEGGAVDTYQAQGGGAVFRFSLPVVAAPEGEDEDQR